MLLPQRTSVLVTSSLLLATTNVLAADLFWDPAPGTAGDQGGAGNWQVGSNFWDGAANAAYPNAATHNAIFRTAGGVVSVTGNVSAATVDFRIDGYDLRTTADQSITSATLTATSLTKSGAGTLTLAGSGNIAGNLNINNSNGALIVQGSLVVGDARFTGATTHFVPALLNQGIHFDGGGSRTFTGKITATNFNQDIVLGARGNTTVTYAGDIEADQSNDFDIALVTGGKVVFGADAKLDLINNAYFTRQFWVYGDGTGTFEMAEGLIADRTQNGTAELGYGAVRLGNATFLTHHSQSLPQHVRPNPINGTPGINGHMIFTDQAGGTWRTATRAQNYQGGVWIYQNATLETATDLTHTGVINSWADYINHGAFQTLGENITITKKGDAKLILNGEQAYQAGAAMKIEAGSVIFQTDAVGGTIKSGVAGQNLSVTIKAGATLEAQVPNLHLRTLSAEADSKTTLGNGSRISSSGTVGLNGTIDLSAIDASALAFLTPIDLITGSGRSGVFAGVIGVAVSPTRALAVTYDSTSAKLTLTVPGDVNLDGLANAADLAIINAHIGLPGTWSTGDVTGDGWVTSADATTIPEPAIFGTGSLGLWALRRRRD